MSTQYRYLYSTCILDIVKKGYFHKFFQCTTLAVDLMIFQLFFHDCIIIQISTWRRQYRASETCHIDSVESLLSWLEKNIPVWRQNIGNIILSQLICMFKLCIEKSGFIPQCSQQTVISVTSVFSMI